MNIRFIEFSLVMTIGWHLQNVSDQLDAADAELLCKYKMQAAGSGRPGTVLARSCVADG
jgi:hypothetical protein